MAFRQPCLTAALSMLSGLLVLLSSRPPLYGQAPSEAGNSATGLISGRVTYQADSERPWRYGRYYIADRRTGALAEAVVALSSRSLRNVSPREDPIVWEMDQKDFRFVPETMVIRAGDRVRFTNSDPAIHNVRTSDGNRPFNVNVATGGEHVEEFGRAGGTRLPIRIGCVLHSTMRAWIYVFDHPYHALTESDGAFRFEDVPAGDYTLELRHPAGDLSWSRDVTVNAGAEVIVNIELSPDNLPSEKDD